MKKWVYVTLLIFFGAVAAFASYKLLSGYIGYKKADKAYEDIRKKAVKVQESAEQPTNSTKAGTSGSDTEKTDQDREDFSLHEHQMLLTHLEVPFEFILWPLYSVDFEELAKISDEVKGWIRIEGTHIDYPIVQHEDDEYYLRHGIDGTYLNTGSIYIEYRLDYPLSTDRNTIIYGHNQRNSAMFHDLVNYLEPEFAADHPYIYIYLPSGETQIYRVFTSYVTPAGGNTYYIYFRDEAEYDEYLQKMVKKSTIDYNVPVDRTDRIITLSTCTNAYDDNRVVVQAKLISVQ